MFYKNKNILNKNIELGEQTHTHSQKQNVVVVEKNNIDYGFVNYKALTNEQAQTQSYCAVDSTQ